MIPEYLNKVMSDKKAIEICDILEAGHPTHSERLWLTGFMKFAGYSMSEVLDIIREHNQWADFRESITAYQVGTVFHQRQVGTTYHKYRMDCRPRKWDLSPTEILRIKYQRSVALSKILCEENKGNIPFQHPERLACRSEFNPSATFLQK